MKRTIRVLTISALSLAILSACEGTKQQLGLAKSAPDEFAVVKRAPLEMPPEFSLRPPSPGAPRPQEQAVAEQARNAVLGDGASRAATSQTTGEEALLFHAGANYNPDIRNIVDDEASRSERKNEPVVKKLLNIGKDSTPAAVVVDPAAEAARLRKNAEEGLPVTDGKTPDIED